MIGANTPDNSGAAAEQLAQLIAALDERRVSEESSSPTGSPVADILARIMTGYSTSRANYRAQVMSERIAVAPELSLRRHGRLIPFWARPKDRSQKDLKRRGIAVSRQFALAGTAVSIKRLSGPSICSAPREPSSTG